MQTILAEDQRALLAGFAHSNVLLAFDYDGTLAPIAPTPAGARMRPETRRLLTVAARLYPCVIISGRALDDLTRRFRGIPAWYLFGNHGLEPARPDAPSPTRAREWALHLKKHLPRDPGPHGQLVEPADAADDLAQDQQGPTVADHLGGALDGAALGRPLQRHRLSHRVPPSAR